jgi:hypothetical protein
MLGVQRMNISKINALNYFDLTYHRRPLLPYLCVMAGRSEMSPEERMRDSDAVLADLQAFNVGRIKAASEQCSTAELNTLIAGAGFSSRRVSGALAASRKGVADAAKAAAASALETLAANENDTDANPETEMDDDSGRTPERMAEIHADIRRRLDAARAARESKQMAGSGSTPTDRALSSGLEVAGGAPEPAV